MGQAKVKLGWARGRGEGFDKGTEGIWSDIR